MNNSCVEKNCFACEAGNKLLGDFGIETSFAEAMQMPEISTKLNQILPKHNQPSSGQVLSINNSQKKIGPIFLPACQNSENNLAIIIPDNCEVTLLDMSRCECQSEQTNSLTAIYCGNGVKLSHIVVKCLSEDQNVTSQTKIVAEKNAKITSIECVLGGGRYSANTQVDLIGENSAVERYGLLLGSQTGNYKFNEQVRHSASKTISHLMFRDVMTEESVGTRHLLTDIIAGTIDCSGRQDARTLLMSKTAKAEIVPALAIGAEEVACSHSASIGQINAETLFYLQSRGIDYETAQKILAMGFFNPLLKQINNQYTEDLVEQMIRTRLACDKIDNL